MLLTDCYRLKFCLPFALISNILTKMLIPYNEDLFQETKHKRYTKKKGVHVNHSVQRPQEVVPSSHSIP